MNRVLKYCIALVFVSCVSSTFAKDTLHQVLRPRIGLGTGVMAYYGEVQSYQHKFMPTVNRYGGLIYVNAPVTKFLNLELSATYAKIAANERSLTRNLNFESRIRQGSIYLYYNFYPFFKEERGFFHPYMGIGWTSFEFLSKSDMIHDATGWSYHYWSDGSIRNMAEDDPDAANATYLQRDYTYETDLRELDLDGLGKYKEQSYAFPMTLGFEFHLSPRWDFRIACVYNLTLTDLIDNITYDAPENSTRRGDKNKDRLVFTYASLSYDLRFKKKSEDEQEEDEDIPLFADFDDSDWDKDGVIDAYDACPGTPLEALVDEKGCPLDGDGDGVPDFLDEEQDTPEGNWVDKFGVTLTEEQIQRHWELYNDSTGYLHDFTELRTVINPAEEKITDGEGPRSVEGRTYMVVIGVEHVDDAEENLHKYLGYDDFESVEKGDSVYYIIGDYKNVQDAVAQKKALEEQDIEVKLIAANNLESGTVTPLNQKAIDKIADINKDENVTKDFSETTQMYRVQLGAFSKKVDLSKSFRDIDDINYAKGDDGLYHYYSGSFETFEEADKHRRFVAYKKGYKSSFVVAYQDESRVLLSDVVPEKDLPDTYDPDKELETFVETYVPPSQNDKVDMAKAKYRVLLGHFEGEVPTGMVEIFYALGGALPVKNFDGSTTYYSKEFNSAEERDRAMDEYQRDYQLEGIDRIIQYEGKYYKPAEWKAYLDNL